MKKLTNHEQARLLVTLPSSLQREFLNKLLISRPGLLGTPEHLRVLSNILKREAKEELAMSKDKIGPVDNFGRPWARVSDTKPGDILECDAGFSCLAPSSLRVVKSHETGLYIQCSEGMHFLDGQEQDGYYIGLYHKKGSAS